MERRIIRVRTRHFVIQGNLQLRVFGGLSAKLVGVHFPVQGRCSATADYSGRPNLMPFYRPEQT